MTTLILVSQLILSLSILVTLHEMGHFFPARFFGMRVDKFYLFFDPWFSIYKVKKGETEYGVGWLPLGGYVKIAGMVDESMDTEALAQEPQEWEFRSKPAWQRLIVMLGGVIVNDFIDMRKEKHRRGLERVLRDAMKRDRARTKILRTSPFGLIEMTRQRIRPSLKRSVYADCPCCNGRAVVKTSESM